VRASRLPSGSVMVLSVLECPAYLLMMCAALLAANVMGRPRSNAMRLDHCCTLSKVQTKADERCGVSRDFHVPALLGRLVPALSFVSFSLTSLSQQRNQPPPPPPPHSSPFLISSSLPTHPPIPRPTSTTSHTPTMITPSLRSAAGGMLRTAAVRSSVSRCLDLPRLGSTCALSLLSL
jgi:hypothetical protein